MSLFSIRRQPTLRVILEQHYIPSATLGKPTIRQYRSDLKRWERVVGMQPAGRIREAHFRQFRRECIDSGLALLSINHSVRVVGMLLRYAQDQGWIRSLPIW